jgi:hypothetical protein
MDLKTDSFESWSCASELNGIGKEMVNPELEITIQISCIKEWNT